MAKTSYEPAGGLLTPPMGCRAQLAAAPDPARPDNKPGRLHREIEAVDRANDRVDHEISFGRFRLLPGRRLLLEGDKPVHLGTRALDPLIALVERHGELVTKPQLFEKVWPRTFVVEGNLKLHIAALRRVLGDGQAGNRYISTVIGRGYCFVAPITHSADRCPATPKHSVAEPSSSVPAPLMRLISRDKISSRVLAQLAHHRLITLVGPGGISKTSIAVATAGRLTHTYEHGIWFIDLTAIGDPRLLPAAVGSAIRLDISAEDLSDRLLSFLSDRRMLVLLDNCEHIIEAAADWAVQVLRAAPCVQILATSREPLSIEGERVHYVQPLEIPAVFRDHSAAEAFEFRAVQLFVECAAKVLGEFTLGDVDVPIVVDICRKLDGIPLAIEIATGSIDALGLRGVVSRLDYPLRLPAIRRRAAVPRHQTLRAALDWSYRLLAEEEQRAFRRVSVFGGSFTVDAAATVAADPMSTESESVDRVISLVTKSLVAADAVGSGSRLRLLATTRTYAVEKLAEAGELDATVRREAGISQRSPDEHPKRPLAAFGSACRTERCSLAAYASQSARHHG